MASKGPASKDGPSRQRRGRGFQQTAESGKLYSDDPEGQAKPVIQPPQQDYRTAGIDYRVSEYETEGRSRPRSYNSGGAYRDSGGRGGRGSGRRSRDGNAEGGVDEGAVLQHTDGGVLGRGPRGRGPRGGGRNGSANDDSSSGANPPGREFGRIASVKESFGFIQCYRRGNTEIFFHVTGLDRDESEGSEETAGGRKPDLTALVEPGQEVEFDYVPVDEKSGKPMARRVKVLAAGALADDISEEVLKGVVDRELRGGQRRREDAYGGRIFVSGKGNESEGEYFPFSAADLAEPSTRLATGDEVEFRTCISKRTGGEKKAVQIKLVSRGERRGAPKADGRPRKGGVVVVLKDTFGFVKTEPEGKVFFHFSHIEVGHTDGAKRLQEDDLVDFVLTTDPNTGKPMATSIRLLPKTESKEEVSQERRTGVVCRQPSQRRDKQVEAGLVHYRDDQGASHLATYGASAGEPSVKPELGDEVSFGVALNPLRKAERAVDLEIVKPMAERRELGVVSLIKDHKFGFIRSSDRTEDTFFHMSEVQKDESTSGLHIGDDVEYTVVHDYRTGKENAIVVKKAAKGSAVLFDVLPERLNGVCIRRVKEAKARGMVEFTVGGEKRSLEFSTNDLQDHRLTPREGEQVEFSIAESRKDKKQHATQIAMKELSGVIDGMKGTYGFIRYGPDLTERVFFHTAEVRGNVKLEKGDHVAMYVVHMEKTGEIAAKRVRRTKEASEEPSTAPVTVAGNGSEATPPPKSNIKFEGSSAVRIAKGPDGSGGFAKGRGKPLAPPAGPVPGHPITQIGSPSSPINVSANEDSTQEGVESLAGKRRDEGSEVDEEEEEAGEDV